MRSIVIWGGTGHARVLNEALAGTSLRIAAVIDNRTIESPLSGVPLFVGKRGLNEFISQRAEGSELLFALAVGGNGGKDRIQLLEYLKGMSLEPYTIVHRTAFVARDSRIGEACQMLAMSAVCAGTSLGRAVIVNTSASVDHDCDIGDGVHIGPGARLAGNVQVGACTFVGTGAVILPNLRIGHDAVIGAGTVVTRDVPPSVTIIGNPGRIVPARQSP